MLLLQQQTYIERLLDFREVGHDCITGVIWRGIAFLDDHVLVLDELGHKCPWYPWGVGDGIRHVGLVGDDGHL